MDREKIIETIEQNEEFQQRLTDLFCDEGTGKVSRKFLIEEVISQYLALKGLDEWEPIENVPEHIKLDGAPVIVRCSQTDDYHAVVGFDVDENRWTDCENRGFPEKAFDQFQLIQGYDYPTPPKEGGVK